MQENGEDIGKSLVTDGLVTVEKRKEKRLQKVLEEYTRAQDTARKARVRMTMKQLERRQFVSLGTRRELEPRNASRNCFWDRYWGRAGRVIVPEVFANVNSAQFFFYLSFLSGRSQTSKVFTIFT